MYYMIREISWNYQCIHVLHVMYVAWTSFYMSHLLIRALKTKKKHVWIVTILCNSLILIKWCQKYKFLAYDVHSVILKYENLNPLLWQLLSKGENKLLGDKWTIFRLITQKFQHWFTWANCVSGGKINFRF